MRYQSDCCWGLWPSESPTGAGGSASKPTNIAFGRKPQFLTLWISSRAVLNIAVRPQNERSTGVSLTSTETCLYNLTPDGTYCHFCRILLVAQANSGILWDGAPQSV